MLPDTFAIITGEYGKCGLGWGYKKKPPVSKPEANYDKTATPYTRSGCFLQQISSFVNIHSQIMDSSQGIQILIYQHLPLSLPFPKSVV